MQYSGWGSGGLERSRGCFGKSTKPWLKPSWVSPGVEEEQPAGVEGLCYCLYLFSWDSTPYVLVCSQGDAEKLAWSEIKSMIKGLLGKVPHSQGPGIFGLPRGGDLMSGS